MLPLFAHARGTVLGARPGLGSAAWAGAGRWAATCGEAWRGCAGCVVVGSARIGCLIGGPNGDELRGQDAAGESHACPRSTGPPATQVNAPCPVACSCFRAARSAFGSVPWSGHWRQCQAITARPPPVAPKGRARRRPRWPRTGASRGTRRRLRRSAHLAGPTNVRHTLRVIPNRSARAAALSPHRHARPSLVWTTWSFRARQIRHSGQPDRPL